MNLNEYQDTAASNAFFSPESPVPGLYEALGMCGEAGEVAEKIKKFWRDGGNFEEVQAAVKKELGDTLWYLSQVARRWGITLGDVAWTNVDKLKDRRKRGVLHGAGDNR